MDPLQIQAQAILLRRKKGPPKNHYEKYQTSCDRYCKDILNFSPWSGENGSKGQLELCQDINESVKEQLKGSGKPFMGRVESANGVGKTFLGSGLANWFFDSFQPSVGIVNAPKDDQIRLLFWPKVKEHRKHDRGELYPSAPMMKKSDLHMFYGRVSGSEEGAKGQHHDFQMFIFEEAEGVPDHYYDAVEQMLTGCKVAIWLLIGNPNSRTSAFFRKKKDPRFNQYRFDLLNYPNVVQGRDVIPGGTRRAWLEGILNDREEPTVQVDRHDPDKHTFELPWMPGVIWLPSNKFLRMCRGITPLNSVGNTFFSEGRIEAAKNRKEPLAKNDVLQIGVDVARYGDDLGKVYSHSLGVCKHKQTLAQLNSRLYSEAIISAIKSELKPEHKSISMRFDGTGGFASGVIDMLHEDNWLKTCGTPYIIYEIHFASKAQDESSYFDIITQVYAEAAETLLGCVLENPLPNLEVDLMDRPYEHRNKLGVTTKKLSEKEKFKNDHNNRSPDDGDAACLAMAPEFVFSHLIPQSDALSVMAMLKGVM